MTKLNYFQRYSQREDHITNNVLLMLRHLYRESPIKLKTVLDTILDDDTGLNVGVEFEQQISSKASRPDGQIKQVGWDIRIEFKPHNGWDEDQLKRHVKGFENKSEFNILLLLSTDKNPDFKFDVPEYVRLQSTTFEDLASAINTDEVIAPHELALRNIYEDFYDTLVANDLITNPYALFAFGCSNTMKWNIENRAYYEPSDRPTKLHVLNGFYGDKAIRAIGRPDFTIIVNFDEDGEVSIEENSFEKNEEIYSSDNVDPLDWIKSLQFDNLRDIQLRVYHYPEGLFANMSTDKCFEKATGGGYQSGVWLNLKKWAEDVNPKNVKELSKALAGKEFGKDRGW